MIKNSNALFERAKAVIPGGVNSPVRAFGSVGGSPRFIKRAEGAFIYDEDGNSYLDYIGSWGPMILGHSNERILYAVKDALKDGLSFGAATAVEVEMAEQMRRCVPALELVRMVNSGTEAVMSALRLARGYTKRDKIIKFEGCYHGHSDSMLVNAGSGALTTGVPSSSGVTEGTARDTLVADYNCLESVEKLLKENHNQVAAIIVEPVAANMGVVPPKKGFLEGLSNLAKEHGSLLIFDEVITGFRLALGGAAEYFGVTPDLFVYGKIIGGGMPVGAYGGRREIMECISPLGSVYQAGTLSGNPLAMAAGLAMLKELELHPEVYTYINTLGTQLAKGLSETGYTVNSVGSLICMFMTKEPVDNFKSAVKSDTSSYSHFFNKLLDKGIYIAPAQFEAMFVSIAHTQNDIARTIDTMKECL